MKICKRTLQNTAQEECGVWLDTVQLKGKAKQKQRIRPISKLLNPLADGSGYSLAVALSFTQTKMEMPKTKQSSISSFFKPHQRVLNRISGESPSMDRFHPFSQTEQGCPTRYDVKDANKLVDCESGNKAVSSQKKQECHSPLFFHESEEMITEDLNSPQRKKSPAESEVFASLPAQSQMPPQAWSQDPLFSSSQQLESNYYLTDKNGTPGDFRGSESTFVDSLQCNEVFGKSLDVEGRTSTQTTDKNYSQLHEDKENSIVSTKSPTKHSIFYHTNLSNRKGAELQNMSLQKHTNLPENRVGKNIHFSSNRTKPSSSPIKQVRQHSREVDEDSFGSLFTQDSEGFRVMAHRGPLMRSTHGPLTDHSNLSTGRAKRCSDKADEQEEEDEMLFTQDSQGNMVIKH